MSFLLKKGEGREAHKKKKEKRERACQIMKVAFRDCGQRPAPKKRKGGLHGKGNEKRKKRKKKKRKGRLQRILSIDRNLCPLLGGEKKEARKKRKKKKK